MRHLLLVLGDQLDRDSSLFDDYDAEQDLVWMAEANGENTHVKHHQWSLVLFLSAMRHFRDELRERGVRVHYNEITPDGRRDRGRELGDLLGADLKQFKPKSVKVVRPGDYRVLSGLQEAVRAHGLELEVLADRHFYVTVEEFLEYAGDRKSLLLENFYRDLRERHNILMAGGEPEGGAWNFDKENRETFGTEGPNTLLLPAHRFQPTPIVKQVQALVAERYADHPGRADTFDLPVTRSQALQLLRDFVDEKLANYGKFQDAMWTDQTFLYHSRLSTSLNLKLLNPRECVEKAVQAYREGEAPLNSVEGFVRQILGWREYVRGVYWWKMPDYGKQNALGHNRPLPKFFWTAETDMTCLRHSLAGVLEYGYAHHIQRLMVIGLFALLAGVDPEEFNDWHVALYCDAIDWVSVPNVIGMSQYADGGLLASKPYCASGNYINKMSNYCKNCRYKYKKAVGEDACPFTTLYWDFLARHAETLEKNGRMFFQMNNLKKKAQSGELQEIREQAQRLLQSL